MSSADLVRLLALAALWGASFLLLRIAVPTMGALVTAELRVLVAGIALLAWQVVVVRRSLDAARHRVPMFVVGVFNSAVPFALYAFAAKALPAGYLAILNATTPLFGALIARFWIGEALGGRRVAGVLVGIAGVAILVRLGPVAVDLPALVGCAAGLAAALSYGFAGNYTRRHAQAVPPPAMATGSQLAAALVLLPLLPLEPVVAAPTGRVVVALLILAVCCTSIAYLLYFRLIRDVGATRAMTVTFLIPVFAIAWGWLVLGEVPTLRMGVGAGLVLVATWLVAKKPA